LQGTLIGRGLRHGRGRILVSGVLLVIFEVVRRPIERAGARVIPTKQRAGTRTLVISVCSAAERQNFGLFISRPRLTGDDDISRKNPRNKRGRGGHRVAEAANALWSRRCFGCTRGGRWLIHRHWPPQHTPRWNAHGFEVQAEEPVPVPANRSDVYGTAKCSTSGRRWMIRPSNFSPLATRRQRGRLKNSSILLGGGVARSGVRSLRIRGVSLRICSGRRVLPWIRRATGFPSEFSSAFKIKSANSQRAELSLTVVASGQHHDLRATKYGIRRQGGGQFELGMALILDRGMDRIGSR